MTLAESRPALTGRGTGMSQQQLSPRNRAWESISAPDAPVGSVWVHVVAETLCWRGNGPLRGKDSPCYCMLESIWVAIAKYHKQAAYEHFVSHVSKG